MIVDSVFVNGNKNEFSHSEDVVLVPLQQQIPQNKYFSVQIYYHGNGAACAQTDYDGISKYFYRGVFNTQTSSEPVGAKVCFPCKQDLTDKADSVTFFITTGAKNISGSNGVLESTENLPNEKVRYKRKSQFDI